MAYMKNDLPWYSCLDCHSLGEHLRVLREKEGLAQKQMVDDLHLGRSTFTYYVGGVVLYQYRLPAWAYAILKDGI